MDEPGQATPYAERGLDARNTILHATYRVVAERGAHRLSMNDIAAEAGVSKGLIHYHFGSKLAVITEALEWAVHATAERIRQTILRAEYQDDPLSGLVAAIFVDPIANKSFYLAYLDLLEHISREARLDALSRMLADVIEGLYEEVLRAGTESGRFRRSDHATAATDVRIVIDGTFVRWLQLPDWETAHSDYAARCRRLLALVVDERAPGT